MIRKAFFFFLLVIVMGNYFCYPVFPKERPLTPDMVRELLKKGVTSNRITHIIEERGINFGKLEDSSNFLKELRNNSANKNLINAVKREWKRISRLLVVETNPPGATVYVDAVERGKSNENGLLTIKGLRPREYTIRVEKEGYKPIEYKISIIEKSKRLIVKLTPVIVEYGLLVVNSSPWSTVCIDGKKVGYTPKKIKLHVGIHQLGLKREGYQDYKQEITIKQKNATRLFIQLQPKNYT